MKKLLQYTLLAIMTFGFVGCAGEYNVGLRVAQVEQDLFVMI